MPRVGYRHGEFVDFDINEALAMQKGISDYQWEVCQSLSHNYDKKQQNNKMNKKKMQLYNRLHKI
mgnify:CR=1 FL=1